MILLPRFRVNTATAEPVARVQELYGRYKYDPNAGQGFQRSDNEFAPDPVDVSGGRKLDNIQGGIDTIMDSKKPKENPPE